MKTISFSRFDGESNFQKFSAAMAWLRENPESELYISRPAVCIRNAEKIRLNNMTIHSHHGMGIVGHLSRDIVIEGLSVIPSSGERMSTDTDATHFASCYGDLIIKNCVLRRHIYKT